MQSNHSNNPFASPKAHRNVMEKYQITDCEADWIGEGTSSVCWKGHNIETGEEVAIKVYKLGAGGSCETGLVRMAKFKRQVEVLQALQSPLEPPEDKRLWNDALAGIPSSQLFLQLIDFSKDSQGHAGPDPKDGVLYIVTELAQYSLKDYLKHRRTVDNELSLETIQQITRAIVLVVAGLHAKGYVHLDLKPENLMLFDGVIKVIDVDGCVRIGSVAYVTDSTLSFSPCYCAPEWASFLIEDSDLPRIMTSPPLDMWSVGMTITELVLLEAMLKSMYSSFLRHGHGHREAGFLFLEWLSHLRHVQLPKKLASFNQDLVDLLHKLFAFEPQQRLTAAEALQHKFLRGEHKGDEPQISIVGDGNAVARFHAQRSEDHSQKKKISGRLWKLNSGRNPHDDKEWLQRDMWITNNGSLCYFSQAEDKRLVLVDGHRLAHATVTKCMDSVRDHSFQLQMAPEHDGGDPDCHVLACETSGEYHKWTTALERIKYAVVFTMHLGTQMAADVTQFKLTIRNRRISLQAESADAFQPVVKAPLWKLKSEGDAMREDDWFLREMWLSKNGSLVYFSVRDQKDLMYYTSTDIAQGALRVLEESESVKPYSFEFQLPSKNGVHFAPGLFAAESTRMRDTWMQQFETAKSLQRN